jgi:hypothetical protein
MYSPARAMTCIKLLTYLLWNLFVDGGGTLLQSMLKSYWCLYPATFQRARYGQSVFLG